MLQLCMFLIHFSAHFDGSVSGVGLTSTGSVSDFMEKGVFI